jgi:hypothetical protein
MKIRVYDSDGDFKGGLLKLDAFNASTCRTWRAPPCPEYDELLMDIAGKGNPCRRESWFLVRLSKNPDFGEGPDEGPDAFDANSQAWRITPNEAAAWFQRNGFSVPPDLVRLTTGSSGQPVAAAVSESTASGGPFLPARWFADEYGLSPERLRSAARRGLLASIKRGTRTLYSVEGAQHLWPHENIKPPD